MGKKIKGELFLLSANELKSGKVVFYTKNGWSENSEKAFKISKNEIEKYEEIYKNDEEKCIIISASFVELDKSGNIKTLRDKIRNTGLTIKID